MTTRQAEAENSRTVRLDSHSGERFTRSFIFEGLEAVITAQTAAEVVPAFLQVEQAVANGRHAAGFVSYEAAAAINPELAVMEPADLPLVWFGIFRERRPCPMEADSGMVAGCTVSPSELRTSRERYSRTIDSIRGAIAKGETYQVNFTTRQDFRLEGNPETLYRRMCRNQLAPFCAMIDTGEHKILSASPELFFSLEGDRISMSPMKGTSTRLPLPADDSRQKMLLAASPKERAENLMIVDLVRNDLSTIAVSGTVQVAGLFKIETYPTVHQMTSTVTARIRPEIGLLDIFRALFPCGSVTGAPKRRTMEIIRQREDSPRGIYCGAIGFASPGSEAVFSVAIRTAVIHTATGTASMGIGSGITWDSDPRSEFEECMAKSAFLFREPNEFRLIESLRHDSSGYLLMERHMERLETSAEYFGFSFETKENLKEQLKELGQKLSGINKVRILLDKAGDFTLEAVKIGKTTEEPLRVKVSDRRVESGDTFLYHKTTRRELYEQETGRYPGKGEIIFLNERSELTEGTSSNIVLSMHGELVTPALASGLLPGVLRQDLLESGVIREKVLRAEDLYNADKVWLINSVRGWREGIMQREDTD